MEKINDKKQSAKYAVTGWAGLLTSTLDAVAAILSADSLVALLGIHVRLRPL